MPELKHHFRAGKMNKDLDERIVPNGEYRDAQNIEISTSEGDDVGTIQNVRGTTQIVGKTYFFIILSFLLCNYPIAKYNQRKNNFLHH